MACCDFPGVNLDDHEQTLFARSLGEIASDWDVSADKSVNSNTVLAEYQKSSVFWHFDGFGADKPEFATIMSPRVLENGIGGATDFASCYAAYRDLSVADKSAFDTLRVEHRFETLMRHVKPHPSEEELERWQVKGRPHTHPLIWHHKSGGNSLLLGSSAASVEGMDSAHARALIVRLNEWITRAKYVFRYEWTLGDLVIWDNTGTLHRAVPYASGSKRLMHRTTVVADEIPA